MSDRGLNVSLSGYVTEELGYSQASVVVVDDDFHWSGLNPTHIHTAIDHARQDANA
ncbi:hypothetical protein [Arthrobacter sp. KK5.5]|uniref:hypothetical protein n=1 Tax=Arthrobacter sp. KK5.5 TaxID=3373084 RepID=UPI003EE710E8